VSTACRAIAQSSGQPCKKSVAAAGEQFCSHHGGKAKTIRRVMVQAVAPRVQSGTAAVSLRRAATVGSGGSTIKRDEPIDVNLTSLQSKCLQFLVYSHPQSGCKCTIDQPCKGIALVQWSQAVCKLAQSAPGSSIFAVPQNNLAALVPHGNNDLFVDLFQAVKIFGSNVFFLPQLFQHIQRSFQTKADDMATPLVLAPLDAEVMNARAAPNPQGDGK
jgi:hypothetical protein